MDGLDEVGLEKLRGVVQAIQEENYAQVVVLCQKLLKEDSHERVVIDLRNELQEAHLVALLQCERYDEVAATTIPEKETTSRIRAIQAYATYKQKKYQTIVSQDSSNDAFFVHLRAQSLHHLSDGTRAMQTYMDQLKDGTVDDETVQLWTNLLAVWMAHHTTPYTPDEDTDAIPLNRLVQAMLRYIQTIPDDTESYPYDLVYNLASLELLTTTTAKARGPWLDLLETAVTACRNATAALEETERASELGPLTAHQALFRSSFWQGGGMSSDSKLTHLPAALALVHRMNRALASSAPAEALDALNGATLDLTLLTGLQRRIWYYNTAVLQYQAARYTDCRTTCLTHFLSPAKNGKKKKSDDMAAATVSYGTKQDQLFWECRAAVLLAYCARKESAGSTETVSLEACVEQLQAAPPSSGRDQCLVFVLTHQAALQHSSAKNADELVWKLGTLNSLPASLAEKPAIVATTAALYQLTGDDTKAAQMLQKKEDGIPNDLAMADFAMSQENYAEAAGLYETYLKRSDVKDKTATKARWVRALSYVDPAKAMEVWSSGQTPDLALETNGDIVSGTELEARELRLKKSSGTRKSVDPTLDVASNKSRKSHESVLRRRARQRDAYLARQQEKGVATTTPDPERWVPKYERANARRRKNRGQHTHSGGAHQGGASDKDAAKLDIVARQAARAAGEDPSSRSTAHLTVSGSRKGKAKRR